MTITDSEVSSAADVFINNIKGHLTVDATNSKITGSANISTDVNTHTYLSLSDNSTWDIKADSTVSNLTVDNSRSIFPGRWTGCRTNKINNN
ncbi:hypothetical protein ACVXG9_06310 [Escherichia coli]